MSRTLKYDIPGIDWRRSLADAYEFGVFSLFEPEYESPPPLAIEIGFGRGEFLLEMAAKYPEMAFLGVEVSWKRVLKMARKVARAQLENVRLVAGTGQAIVHDCVPDDCIRDIWVNFSDPWPKSAHAHRRLFQPEFVRRAAQVLDPGGILHVATDDPIYADQIDQVLGDEPLFENLHAPASFVREVPGRIATSYEIDWRAGGRQMHFFDHRRVLSDPVCGDRGAL
ncbi:MAG: tRNA (guanosine(46)-N7)-methyltransferase TrmB [Deltaproteobacteria bacterium]|nr:tRNA (guanosine(46)-N7)-methyltransferase TrmB [Deltaproteobacteria bacterium]